MDNRQQKVNTLNSRNKRKSKGTRIAIITLSILLGFSIVLGVAAAFFSANANAAGDITLGDPVNISITQGGASVSTLTFSGNAMPGTVYDQKIGVTVPTGSSDCVVRAKLSITNSNNAAVNVTAETTNSWVAGEDDYYYYNGKLGATDSADFVTSITVPKTLTNSDANKTYALSIQVESIQFANGAASEVWTTAPTTWTTAYGSGV